MSDKEDAAKLSHGRMSFRTTNSVSTLLSWVVSDADTTYTLNEDGACVDDDDDGAICVDDGDDKSCSPVIPASSRNGEDSQEGRNVIHDGRHDFQMDYYIKDEIESEVDMDESCLPLPVMSSSNGEDSQADPAGTNATHGGQDFGMDFFIKDEVEDSGYAMSRTGQRRGVDDKPLSPSLSDGKADNESSNVWPTTVVEPSANQPSGSDFKTEQLLDVDDSEDDEIDVEDVDKHYEESQAQLLVSAMNVSVTNPSSSTSFKHKCNHCWRSFEEKQALIDHLHSDHDVFTPQCHICQKICRTKQSLQKHVRIHDVKKMYKCYICNRRGVISLWELKRHVRTVHGAVMPFQCHICKKKFVSEAVLKSHQTVHTGTQPYECDVCHRRFVCKRSLTKHKRAHVRKSQNELASKCSICMLTLKSSSSLATHQKGHSKLATSWKCPICALYFKSTKSLNTHLELHRAGKLNELEEITKQQRGVSEDSLLIKEPSFLSSDNPRPKEGMKVTSYECDLCGKSFKKLHDLRRHRIRHTGALMYRCESCNLDFNRYKEWTEHNKIHYVCQHCERRFPFQSFLDRHVKTVHVKEKAICDICGKSVVSITQHKSWFHRHRADKFRCQTCHRWVDNEEELDFHKLYHETKGTCRECGKTFPKPYMLKRHLETHDPKLRQLAINREKTHVCEICSKSYRTLTLLEEHKVAVHEGAKNHQCEHCGKTYFYIANVRWHKKLTGCGKKSKKGQPKSSSVLEDTEYIP